MSDWPADIDPTPPKRAKLQQRQFALRHLLLIVAAVAVILALSPKLGFAWAAFVVVVTAIAWFCGSNKLMDRLHRLFMGAIVLLVGLMVAPPSLHNTLGPRRRMSCMTNMREIAQAILSYQNAKGHLPPPYVADENGKPLYSWRVLILPYLERRDIMGLWKFDEPWDSPNNKPLSDVYLEMFRCQSDVGDGTRKPLTNYVAVVGSGTAWEQGTRLNTASFKDGAGNTLLLVEIADSDIHWAEPRDLNFSKMAMTINPASGHGVSSKHPSGTPVVFANKRVTLIRNDTMPNVLKSLLTRDGGETVNSSDFE